MLRSDRELSVYCAVKVTKGYDSVATRDKLTKIFLAHIQWLTEI